MKSSNNVILITGGGAGIGYETAKLFATQGNQVIIVGSNPESLQKAAATLPGVVAIPTDVTDEPQVDALVARLNKDFGKLNVLINNAGVAYKYDLLNETNLLDYARREMEVNYFAPIRLTDKLLPLLRNQPEAAIINVTSILAISPLSIWSTYSASKAALQSYTKVLRLLAGDKIRVIEVLPPLTDTNFAKDIPGAKISPEQVATSIVKGFLTDTQEIRIGFTENFYQLFLQSPQSAFNVMHGIK